MNPLLIIGLIVGGLILAGTFVALRAFRDANEGYQDEKGFHPGHPKK